MPDPDQASDRLHDALFEIVREASGGMVSKWVCLMEVINADGERSMWSLTSPDLATWDQLGMVEFHRSVLRSQAAGDGDV